MSTLSLELTVTASAVAAFGVDFAALTDSSLIEAQRSLAAHRAVVDRVAAGIAGEIARRSSHELGYAGLAQREGYLSPQAMVQSLTKSTRSDAAKFVAVGIMQADDSPVAAALDEGVLSVDAAAAIGRGLGAPDPAVNLSAAQAKLIQAAPELDADALFKRARQLREEAEVDAVARREKQQRDLRYLKAFKRADGMVAGSFLLDAEEGAFVLSTFNTVLSPRRGGPRFADPLEQAAADSLVEDERSNEQIAADALVALLKIAGEADSGRVYGSRRPAVRVIVTAENLANHTGTGRIEDTGELISIDSVAADICVSGIVGIRFDENGQVVDLGKEQRLFSVKQKIGLAVRDGGCRVPGCDRPPSETEAHHINFWARDDGRTDIADGILLCRRHHLLMHNNHWEIVRDGATYWLIPPKTIDPAQRPRLMPSRSPELARFAAAG